MMMMTMMVLIDEASLKDIQIFIVIVIFLVIIPMYSWFGGNTCLESPQSVQLPHLALVVKMNSLYVDWLQDL